LISADSSSDKTVEIFEIPDRWVPYSPPLSSSELSKLPDNKATNLDDEDKGRLMEFHICIKHQNFETLVDILMKVSDPTSSDYGKHLSLREVNEIIAPTQESIDAVLNWLSDNNVPFSNIFPTANHDMLKVFLTIGEAEKLLNARFQRFIHLDTKSIVTRTLKYTLPESVADFIDVIGPTTRFPPTQMRIMSHNMKVGESSVEGTEVSETIGFKVTPNFLRSLYQVGDTSNQSPSNQQSVTGFLDQYISPSDLSSFEDTYAPFISGQTANIYGPNVASDPGIEASLDIQYVMAMGAGINTTFWSTAGQQPHNPENEPFLVFLYAVGNHTNPPYVFSMSYGDNEDTVEFDYAVRVNSEFVKMGARGITLLASSGDGGVAGSQTTSCTNFIPTFPAASPYVTAVGGTTQSSPEIAAYFSSGGFSNRWNRPSYQDSFVSQYFSVAQNLPSSSVYNSSGNGFPDVSAQGIDFEIYYNGVPVAVSGTSCSSPTFAGIVGLLNDIRIQAGKSTLGFLNPLFYMNPSVFMDITSGNNPGCNTNGFYCAAGWDPVTGLGTPNFQSLSQLVSSLP
jgi:tripeptidyl-peptidase-1